MSEGPNDRDRRLKEDGVELRDLPVTRIISDIFRVDHVCLNVPFSPAPLILAVLTPEELFPVYLLFVLSVTNK